LNPDAVTNKKGFDQSKPFLFTPLIQNGMNFFTQLIQTITEKDKRAVSFASIFLNNCFLLKTPKNELTCAFCY